MTRKSFFCLLLLLFSLSVEMSLFAQGGGENGGDGSSYSITDARELVANRNYNEAMAILVEIVRNDPEQMELAQKLIVEIREKRDLYNEKYEDLMQVLFVDEDYEQSLVLIQELESLDPNPNVATQDAIRDARISAELVYNRSVFTQIMNQALVFLGDGKYYQAIQLYETGFALSRRTFDETDYDILIKDPIYRTMDNVVSILDGLDETWESYLSSTENYLATAETAPIDSENWQILNDSLEELLNLRRELYISSTKLIQQNQLIEQTWETGQQDFYVSFMERLMRGRNTQEQREGIVTALDFYIDQSYGLLENYYENRIADLDGRALAAYQNNQWNSSVAFINEAILLEGQWDNLLLKNNQRIHIDEDFTLDRMSLAVANEYYPKYYENRYDYEKRTLLVLEGEARSSYTDQLISYEDESLDNLWRYRELVKSPLDNLNGQYDRVLDLEVEITENPYINPENLQLDRTMPQQRYNDILEDILNFDNTIVLDLSQQELSPLESLISEYEERLSVNQLYIEGETQELNEIALLVRFPQRALTDLELLEIQMEQLDLSFQEYVQTYSSEQQVIYRPDSLKPDLDKAQEMIDLLRSYQDQLGELKVVGEDFIYQAQENSNQGNFRYNNAETELSRFNFDRARSELGQAQTYYTTALSFDEDIFSRQDISLRIEDLQTRILDEENKQVIRDVRSLINDATSDYFQGLYLRSEASLIQAENRWATTNTTENDEVAYWLGLVRAALSVESGRTLEETNPLFRDITQLLNLAYQSYEEGKTLWERGDQVGAVRALDTAKGYVNQILIPLPINQDARVLNLRIARIMDESRFNETFQEMFRGARNKIQTQNDVDNAYLDLKDLQRLEPDYPGLAELILEAEYQLGIRARPPNPADLRESRTLYAKAREVFQSGNLQLYDSAIEDLNRAIQLNPQNRDAIALKDEMSLFSPSQAVIVLPAADQILFQEAEDKFINGQYLQASIIVDQLISRGNNRFYAPLQLLKRRIEPFIQ